MTPSNRAVRSAKRRRFRAFMAQPFKHPKSGTFYIRRKVPAELQGILGHEYKRSLKTKDPHAAKRAFAAAYEESEQVFALARAQAQGVQVLNQKDLRILAGRWFEKELAQVEASGEFSDFLAEGATTRWEQGDHYEAHTPLEPFRQVIDEMDPATVDVVVLKHARDALRDAAIPFPGEADPLRNDLLSVFRDHWLKLSSLAAARAGGDWISKEATIASEPLSLEGPGSSTFGFPVGGVPDGRESRPRGLLDAFEGYASERFLNDGEGREVVKSVAAYRASMVEFTELVGDVPLARIDRELVGQYRALLVRLPRSGAGIRSMLALEKIKVADQKELPLIGAATVRNKIRALSSVLSYAVRMQWMSENPVIEGGIGRAVTRAASRRGAARKQRNHYDQAELAAIFGSPAFSDPTWRWPSADYGRAWYWLPVLMYYTGARREEIAQLWVRDVRFGDGQIPHLSILNAESDEDNGRTVKTAASRRLIPLHRDLKRLGFFEYVQTLDAGGQLFPKLRRSPSGYFGANFGKRWAQYLRETVKLASPANPSHGFRHTFKTLSRLTGIPEDVGDAISGHVGQSRVARSYGEMPLARMAEELEKLPSAPLAGLA